MIIYQCDRCQTVLEAGSINYTLKYPLLAAVKEIHLCGDCLRKFYKWLGIKVTDREIEQHEAQVRAKL